ncbi:MAG TPA: chloride channel protein [Terriglobia bacterium]|nr:chloride channel protein [Terriglobia bacterium]
MPEQIKQKKVHRELLHKYASIIRQDLAATYSRDLHKWLIVGPIIGVAAGLVTTCIAIIILNKVWPPLLHRFLLHHWQIIPIMLIGFVATGLIMQYLTPDPNEHSTEEIIRSYHHHHGDVNMRPFIPKLLAAVTTVGFGGSAALEGPSIYGGGALGSWLWAKLRRVGLEPRDRRIMLISGAAAGMAAVFRAPLTGLVFALEMPYKDDLAHEALVPSLIASVVSYVTLISFLGSGTLFDFPSGSSFSRNDLVWSAVLGAVCGLIAMAFDIAFRRFRTFMVRCPVPHWIKLAAGGLLTALCGLVFISAYPGTLIPLGPNYEAVGNILTHPHNPLELINFGILKLVATLASLGVGGVSAMFVPLFLTGGAFGKAFAMIIAHNPGSDLFAAVGMAAFIAGGYKTPLTAVVFVAEATGGHAYIIPTLIGAAVAYAVSGEASASGDQRLHEGLRIQELGRIPVREVMQENVMSLQASSSVQALAEAGQNRSHHTVFPVYEGDRLLGTAAIWSLAKIDPRLWPETPIRSIVEKQAARIPSDCDVMEALRLLRRQGGQHILLVTSPEGRLEGIITKADILAALEARLLHAPPAEDTLPDVSLSKL